MRTEHQHDFESFVAGSQHRLFRQAVLLAGDRAAAQDLVQQSLVSLYVAWPRVREPGAYARRILVRAFLDTKRRRGREHDLHALSDGAPPERDPSLTLTVRGALAELPPRTRAVVVLRYWEDRSVEETARLLGCSTGTVKSTASKGLSTLRDLLGDEFDLAPDPTPAARSASSASSTTSREHR